MQLYCYSFNIVDVTLRERDFAAGSREALQVPIHHWEFPGESWKTLRMSYVVCHLSSNKHQAQETVCFLRSAWTNCDRRCNHIHIRQVPDFCQAEWNSVHQDIQQHMVWQRDMFRHSRQEWKSLLTLSWTLRTRTHCSCCSIWLPLTALLDSPQLICFFTDKSGQIC